MAAARPLKVFLSYSHKDEELCDKLREHLAQLLRDGLIEDWHDRQIMGGEDWAEQIDDNLKSADIILLLISSAFISSEYCYAIEMKHAMERDASKEARVVPIILRPADWESAPFARLQAFPKNGKPVTDWKSEDQAFRDVAKRLRKLTTQQKKIIARHVEATDSERPRCLPWLLAAAFVLLLMIGGGWWYLNTSPDPQIAEDLGRARTYLNTGLYFEADEIYQAVLAKENDNPAALFGQRKTALAQLRQDRVKFGIELDALLRQSPADPDLLMLSGDRLLATNDSAGALEAYRSAVQGEPELAEAHFRLGVLYDRQGEAEQAIAAYKQAVALASETPHYRNNLAYMYALQGDFAQAIEAYGQIPNYPLAALELAKVHWLQGDLEKARQAQLGAQRLLADAGLADQGPWTFRVGASEAIKVNGRAEKACYVKLSLLTTEFLQHRNQKAGAGSLEQECANWLGGLKQALRYDLDEVLLHQPQLAEQIEIFQQGYLAED